VLTGQAKHKILKTPQTSPRLCSENLCFAWTLRAVLWRVCFSALRAR